MELAGTGPPREAAGQGGRGAAPPHKGSGTRFSGAPLWRFALRREEQHRLRGEEKSEKAAPEGYALHSEGWYWSAQQRLFWQGSTQKFFAYSESTKEYTEVTDPSSGPAGELHFAVDASCAQRPGAPREDRHVIIRDLVKAGQALRMPVDHLERPSALFALYDGHRPQRAREGATEAGADAPAPACAEFCARSFHLKLLPRLAELRDPSDTARIEGILRASCEELDAEFLARPGAPADGCTAVFALLSGRRLFLASVGDAAGFLAEEVPGGPTRVAFRTARHVPSAPGELARVQASGGTVVAAGPSERLALRSGGDSGDQELLWVTRAFGDRAFKGADGAVGPLCPTPETAVLELSGRPQCLLLACSDAVCSLEDGEVLGLLQRRKGRPRVACGALLQLAQRRGAPGSLTALCVYFDWRRGALHERLPEQQPQKRARTDPTPQARSRQVRCRHILVKHKDCKDPVDRVRNNRPVARCLAEAEGLLRESLEAIEGDRGRSVFTQRCKAVSECSTCLKGGEMAGDLGWMSRGQLHPAVEAAAFALPVGHMSDIVESDEGVHVLWRIA